ncbi:MAG: DUF655 domain-containing protein [Candidatus Bathyarchaeia archaeon]
MVSSGRYGEVGSGRRFEEYAYVLDYLPYGKLGQTRGSFRARPMIQVVGETYFTLLEAGVKEGATVTLQERVYVGKGPLRDKVSHIIGRVTYGDLTSTARGELPIVVESIVRSQETRFIEFFNTTPAITPRMHSLELIPGIGKKYMWGILDQRERKLFSSFKDLQDRARIPNPAKLVTKRIMEELSEESKYRLFTRPH